MCTTVTFRNLVPFLHHIQRSIKSRCVPHTCVSPASGIAQLAKIHRSSRERSIRQEHETPDASLPLMVPLVVYHIPAASHAGVFKQELSAFTLL